MATLLDRGDSYRVAYLGCAQLQHMATGLGAVQKPLRELYIKARKPSNSTALQQRQLTMTHDGMRVSYKPKASAPLEEEFYAVPDILLWDAVQFISVKSSDKKDKRARVAFEPLDNDHSRNKDNLFAPLDKKYKFLLQQQHGAIFTCVLRRTRGVRALDIHAFMCATDDEALGIVRALNTVHSSYSTEQASETGVLKYTPFGKKTVRVAAGVELAQSPFAKTPPPSVRRFAEHNRLATKSAATGQNLLNAQHKKPAQQPHVKNVFHSATKSDAQFVNNLAQQRRVFHLSQEDLSGPKLQIRSGFEDYNPDLATTAQQEQLSANNRLNDLSRNTPSTSAEHRNTERVGINYSASFNVAGGVRLRQKADTSSDNPAAAAAAAAAASAARHRSAGDRHSVHDPLNAATKQPFSYLDGDPKRDQSSAAVTSAGQRSPSSEGRPTSGNLGQGYSLLSGHNDGSIGALPSGRVDKLAKAHTVSVAQNRQLFRDLQDLQSSKSDTAQNGGGPVKGQFLRPPKSPGYLDKPPNMEQTADGDPIYENTRKFNFPVAQHQHDKSATPSVDVAKSATSSNDAAKSSASTEATQTPPPRQKPVARVPPHVKTGVRVLPKDYGLTTPATQTAENASSNERKRAQTASDAKRSLEKDRTSKAGFYLKPTAISNKLSVFEDGANPTPASHEETSSAERPKTGLFRKWPPTGSLPDSAPFGSPPRRSKSQFSLTYNEWSRAADDGDDFVQARAQLKNWQAEANAPNTDGKPPKKNTKAAKQENSKTKDKQIAKNSLREHLKAAENDKKVGEKLLMSKKKDAEIASVLQDLRLDYRDTPTLTPGAPSGQNFERSLGYFP